MQEFKKLSEHETFEEYREAYEAFLEKHPDLKHARQAYFDLTNRIWEELRNVEARTVERVNALAKEHDEAKMRVFEARFEANRKETEERIAAIRKETEERLTLENFRCETRLANDRHEAEKRHKEEHGVLMAQIREQKQEREARHQIELARIEEIKKETDRRIEDDRKEFASQKRWLVGIFVTGIGIIGAVIYTVITLTNAIAANSNMPV